MSRPLVRSELVGSQGLIWLLSVTYAGRVFRWSSRPVDLTDSVTGEVLPFDGGLGDVKVEDVVELLGAAPAELSIPFSVVFPVDVALWIQRGHSLAGVSAEVATVIDNGTATYNQRRVVLVGTVVQPTYGADGEPVAFSVEAPPWSDAALIPNALQRANASAPSSELGKWFPLVFGTPGAFTDATGTAAITSGSPAIITAATGVDADTLLIAGHWVDAANVRIYDKAGAGENFAVTNTTNSSGRVAEVDVTAAATVDRTSDEWWVGWNDGGGMLNDVQDAPRTGAGEVLEWALRLSTVQIDSTRWANARRYLNRFKLSGYIDEPVSPWEWAADNVLPLLPVSIRTGPEGTYPVIFRYDATAEDAVEHIVAGAGIVRDGDVVYPQASDEVYNEIRVQYAKRAKTRQPYRLAIIGPADPGGDADVSQNYYARISATRYGTRSTVIDTDIVYDTATAVQIGQWKARALSLASREVSYSAPFELGWLEPGDVVTLTDAELHLSEHVVHLTAVQWAPDGVTLTFLIPDDPPRDSRAT